MSHGIVNTPGISYPELIKLIGDHAQSEAIPVNTPGEDLNDYIEGKIWYFPTTAIPSHSPDNSNGYLVVIRLADEYLKQFWIRSGTINGNSDKVFIRSKFEDEWTDWSQFSTSDHTHFIRKLNSSYDLDNIVEPGTYYYTSDSIPTHAPYTGSSLIEVVGTPVSSTNAIIQYGTNFGVAENFKKRVMAEGNWTQWNIYNATNDTGWINLPLAAGVTSAGYTPRFRKIGNQVFVEGRISFNKPTATDNVQVATLPEGYRPNYTRYDIAIASSIGVARLQITSAGALLIDVIYPMYGGTAVTGVIGWIELYTSFFTD